MVAGRRPVRSGGLVYLEDALAEPSTVLRLGQRQQGRPDLLGVGDAEVGGEGCGFLLAYCLNPWDVVCPH